MKKLFLIFILSLFYFGCSGEAPKNTNTKESDNGFRIIVIDGCEYIECVHGFTWNSYYSYTLTHKGDCKNPIHIHNGGKHE